MNIAIDGPAGAGKSSIAKRVAKEMNFIYVDTGAMYRTMALYCLQNGINTEDEEAVCGSLDKINIELKYEDDTQHIYLNDVDVSEEIRKEEVGNNASKVAKYKVRERLVQLQRQIANDNDVIMDGRDIGTVVLPNAQVKIYLTASSKVRAQRRHKELLEKGQEHDINEIEKDIINRDQQDMNREVSPLKQAEDAILVDSSDMTIDQVVEKIISLSK